MKEEAINGPCLVKDLHEMRRTWLPTTKENIENAVPHTSVVVCSDFGS